MNKVGDTFFPGSKEPFRPINPWGRKAKATTHDGRELPADWRSPLLDPLYQVHVEDRESGGVIPVGPNWSLAEAEQLRSTLNIAIKANRITGWSNPHLVKTPPQRAVARIF